MIYIAAGFVTLCWMVFVIFWFASSFSQKTVFEKPKSTKILIPLLLIPVPFILLIRPEWFYLSAMLLENSLATEIAAMIICLLGLLVCIWARVNLASNWSFTLDLKKGHELIRTGPYRFIRHPIYTGILLMFLSSALIVGKLGGVLGLAILLIRFLLRIAQEEELMTRQFPAEYGEYKKSTNALVPFVW
jgi:protein-S-isoprenylcysteine O-methyltransferase Ste14